MNKNQIEFIETDNELDSEVFVKHGDVTVSFEKHISVSYKEKLPTERDEYISCEIQTLFEGDTRKYPQGISFNKNLPIDDLIKALQKAKKLKKGRIVKGYERLFSPFTIDFDFHIGKVFSWKKPGFHFWKEGQTIEFNFYILHITLTIPWKSFWYWLKGDIKKADSPINGWMHKEYLEEKNN